MYSSKNECVEAACTCSWSQERGLHLTPSDRFPPCPIANVNLTWAVHDLQIISQKDNISTADIEAAAGIVDQALQVGALDELIPKIVLVLLLRGLILLQHTSYSYSAGFPSIRINLIIKLTSASLFLFTSTCYFTNFVKAVLKDVTCLLPTLQFILLFQQR